MKLDTYQTEGFLVARKSTPTAVESIKALRKGGLPMTPSQKRQRTPPRIGRELKR